MSIGLRVIIGIVVVVYIVFIVMMIKKGKLNLKYSLLWMLLCAFFLFLIAFPDFIKRMQSFGFASPVNGWLTLGILFCLLMLMMLSVIVSQQNNRIKDMAQYVAMLEKKVRDGEKENEKPC